MARKIPINYIQIGCILLILFLHIYHLITLVIVAIKNILEFM